MHFSGMNISPFYGSAALPRVGTKQDFTVQRALTLIVVVCCFPEKKYKGMLCYVVNRPYFCAHHFFIGKCSPYLELSRRLWSVPGILMTFFKLHFWRGNCPFGFERAPSTPLKGTFFLSKNCDKWSKPPELAKSAGETGNNLLSSVAFVEAWIKRKFQSLM